MAGLLKVLHFEADANDAERIRSQLAQEGLAVDMRPVRTGSAFVDALREGGFDLILSEYFLSGFDGASVLRLAHEHCAEIPLIFVAGVQLREAAWTALAQGASDFVPKSRLGRLAPAIRRALDEASERDRRRRAEAECRENERRTRDMLNLLPPRIFVKDTEGRFQFVNQAFADAYGTSVQSLIGKREEELSGTGQEVLRAREQETRILHTRQPSLAAIEERTDARGEKRVLRTSKLPFAGPDGATPLLLGMSLDITEEHRAQNDVRLAAIAFESHEAIFITDCAGSILKVNKAFSLITGYSAQEAIGTTAETLFRSDRHDQAFYDEQRRSLETTGRWQGEMYNRRKGGELFPVWETITAVRGADGAFTHCVSHFQDISERKQVQAHMEHLAYHDPLTHLPNRSLLLDRLQQALASYRRRGQHGALLFLDLDQFKAINDSLGHPVGDLLLCEVAKRLSMQLRKEDTVARLGGDEFVVLLAQLDGTRDHAAREARSVAEKIHDIFNIDFNIAGYALRVGASIGVAVFPDKDETADEVLRHADIAMYRAKMGGRRTVSFFSREMQVAATERMLLETQLRHAVERHEFAMHFQPQVEISSGRILGGEGLIRWNHPDRGALSPGLFVPVLEESGLIVPVGDWVLASACHTASALAPGRNPMKISANLSPRQFHHPGFVDRLRSILDVAGVRPESIELELTEAGVTRDLDDTVEIMRTLKGIGLRFSLDDFGTGYSSLSYVKRLPLDTLKIDRAFVNDCISDRDNAAIVRTIIAMGKSLDLDVVAEGVETEDQLRFLGEQGCLAYQGYHFRAPMPEREFRELIKQSFA